MDGFEENNGVILSVQSRTVRNLWIPALLRPGRFDRRVPVELPDLKGREDILKVSQKSPHGKGRGLSEIARMASGASGAELANIVNEAALRAVRDSRHHVTQEDLEESIEVVIAGYQKKNAILTDKEKHIVAYHEIGTCSWQPSRAILRRWRRSPSCARTSGALGYTMQADEGNHYLMSKEEIENKIATLTGGRAAEEARFGSSPRGRIATISNRLPNWRVP